MKKPLFSALIALITLCGSQAQEVKSQSEIIRNNVSKGEYKIVADLYRSHYDVVDISDISFHKDQPNEHFVVSIRKYPNHSDEKKSKSAYTYFPDDMAFPATYISSYYVGNDKLKEQVGYVVENKHVGDDRIVFVDDYLFMLQKWKSKDQYEIRWVTKAPKVAGPKTEGEKPAKKKKGGFFKQLKAQMNRASAGIDIDAIKAEILQPYLDVATKKQETFYASWIKKPENARTKKYIDDKRAMMKKAIKQYNDDIFNSPEYQRMLAYQKWIDNSINMTVKNNKGTTVWVGSSATAFITTEIAAGASATQTCTGDLYYYYSDSKGSQGTKFYSADSACGSSVTIN
jgi:hypothetical protein